MIFVSILVSSVVFGIWPITNVWLRTLAHLLLLPLVVGITYEFNRWVGRHVQESRLAKILTAPRHVDAELHHQRAGRLHDRVRHPVPGTGAAQRKGEGRMVTLPGGAGLHRCGIAISGPVRTANRAAARKQPLFFRRWRRFRLFPSQPPPVCTPWALPRRFQRLGRGTGERRSGGWPGITPAGLPRPVPLGRG